MQNSSSTPALSKEEMRLARLRALGGDAPPSSSGARGGGVGEGESKPAVSSGAGAADEGRSSATSAVAVPQVPSSVNRSLPVNVEAKVPPPSSAHLVEPYGMTPDVVSQLSEVIISPDATHEDMSRWFSQGCEFAGGSCPNYLLRQSHGGPCGVLAALQAEILQSLYFREGSARLSREDQALVPLVDAADADRLLLTAIWKVLRRASERDFVIFVYCDISDVVFSSWPNAIDAVRIPSEAAFLSFASAHLGALRSTSGCMLVLLSLALSRGVEGLQADMDDPTNGLIGSFGHCTQEMVNLLLSGRATSNVFDGSRAMGDSGLTLKGVARQNEIGYLSQLEALRYCQVGSFYKTPRFPIWVIGSSSHFTILFTLNSEINMETSEEQLLSAVKREFRRLDADENGYIPADALQGVLVTLGVDLTAEELVSVRSIMDPDGYGIVLWGSFWPVVSRVCSGEALEDAIAAHFEQQQKHSTEAAEQTKQIMGASADATRRSSENGTNKRPRSDSDIAREMQEEWNRDELGPAVVNSVHPLVTAPRSSAPAAMPRSDSDLARMLQEQWDDGNYVSPSALGDTRRPEASSSQAPVVQPATTSAASENKPQHHDSIADASSEKFVMYHFNGLETAAAPPRLARFTIQRRSTSGLIGQPVPIDADVGVAYSGSYNCPMEQILRTRWPGCRLEWEGAPPSVD